MLDLQPIKDDLEAATSWSSHSGDNGELHRKAAEYISALVAEVERLRAESDEDTNRIYELQKQVDVLQEENFALRQRAHPAPARPAATVRNMAALVAEVERLRAAILEHKTKLLEELDLEFQQPNPVDYKLWEVIDD